MRRKILVCDVCEGAGVMECCELVDYHHNDYDRWTVECHNCKGSGLIVKITTIVFEPHKPDTPRPR